MNKPVSSTASGEVSVGTGEFQIKDVHVRAKVEVSKGTIFKVSFTSPSGETPTHAPALIEQLTGQSLSEALTLNARGTDPTGDRESEDPSKVAMFEAFHRAVEACFDRE